MRGRRGTGSEPEWVDEPEVRLVGDERGTLGWQVAAQTPAPRSGNRRPGRWFAAAVLAVVLLLALVSGLNRRGASHTAIPALPLPLSAAPPSAPRGTADAIPLPVPAFPGSSAPSAPAEVNAIDIAVSAGVIYVLTGGDFAELVRTNAAGTSQVRSTVRVGATALAVDGSSVWVLTGIDSEHPNSSRMNRYDARTLAPIGATLTIPGSVSALAAGDDTVWLASTAGLYYVRGGRPAAPVGGVLRPVQALSLDGARHRLIAALPGSVGTALVSVDPGTATVTGTGHLPLVDVSLAAAAHSVWYAGFGDPGGYGGIGEFLPNSLVPGPDRADQLSIGPGARIWAGEQVIWVNSSGSGLTSCISDTTGKALATWVRLTGPFASVRGLRTSIGTGAARRLTATGGCLG